MTTLVSQSKYFVRDHFNSLGTDVCLPEILNMTSNKTYENFFVDRN